GLDRARERHVVDHRLYEPGLQTVERLVRRKIGHDLLPRHSPVIRRPDAVLKPIADQAVAVEIAAAPVSKELRRLPRGRHAHLTVRTERVPGGIGCDRGDAGGRVLVRTHEDVELAARKAGTVDGNGPPRSEE